MISRQKSTIIERGFLAFLLLLCVTLALLQHRWTGEIARAETERLRTGLESQGQAFVREFDAELTASCEQLSPLFSAANTQNRLDAHLAQFKAWKATGARPIFRRIGVAQQTEGKKVALSMIDQAASTISPAEWPAGWAALQQAMDLRARGGPPPSDFSSGLLLEFPLFLKSGPPDGEDQGPRDGDGPGGGRKGEHWLILELDSAYLRDHWLPELAAKHLNPAGSLINDAEVRTSGSSSEILWSTAAAPAGSSPIQLRFNHLGRTGEWSALPRGRGTGAWILDTWPRPGALEKLVSGSRRKNLTIAVLLSGLITAAGLALLLHSRKSRQLAEARLDFVATVSHELRTPLTVISGAAHNLGRGLVPADQTKDYAAMIGQHAQQLKDMVEQVLDFAKEGGHGLTLKLVPLVTADFLQETLAMARHDPRIASCTIETDLPDDLSAMFADPEALRRAIFNLLSNAAKHSGQPWIRVSAAKTMTQAKQPCVEISITDRGPGIPVAEQKAIFRPFHRGAAARQNQTRGSGIGLSVVQDIMTAHHGSVHLKSTPGQGSTFTLSLPALPV